MASIAFGLGVILWLQCVLEGRNRNMIETVTSTQTGHLQVFREEFYKTRLIQHTLEDVPPGLEALLPPGSEIARRLYFPALLSSGEQSVPVMIEGIEPEREGKITKIASSLKQGAFLSPDPSGLCEIKELYIGGATAQILNVEVGSKVVMLGAAADGSLGNDLFRVKGIFETGSPDFDKGMAFSSLGCVRKVAAVQGIHEVVIKLPHDSFTRPVQAAIQARLPAGVTAITWMKAVPRLASVLKYNEATLVMVSVLLFCVMVFGIMNTLFVSIFERTREFGLMIALGTLPSQVRAIVFMESLLMGSVSSLAGTGVGSLVVLYHRYRGFDIRPFVGESSSIGEFNLDFILYPQFEFIGFLKYLALANVLILFAGILPAIRASRLNPVETLRSN